MSGRGPCKIEENNTKLKNYIGLKIEDVTFYVQCAGPNSVTIMKSTLETARTKQINKRDEKNEFKTIISKKNFN